MKEPKRPRILVTPSPVVWKLLDDLHKLTGKPKAGMVAELLHEIAPVMQEQLEAMRELAAAPDKARQLVDEYAWRSVHTIAQAQLDLPSVKKGRAKKNATP